MDIIFNILLIFVLAFVIGMFVAFLIWLLYSIMSGESLERLKRRETYHELKRLRHKKYNGA